MSERLFYVYEHWRLDKDECFYVGKGKKSRANSRSKRNRHWHNIVAKLERMGASFEVRIVAGGLTEEEAFNLEKERILFWRDIVDLANKTDGGEGASGHYPSAETRAKIAEANRNRSPEVRAKVANANRNRSPEVRAKLSEANKRRVFSAETRAKLSKASKNMPSEIRAKIAEKNRKRKQENKHV